MNLGMMGSNDSVAKSESESKSFFTVAHLVLDLIELIEDFFNFFLGNAHSRIDYRKSYAAFSLSQLQRNAASFWSEFVGIGQKIEQDLLNAIDINRKPLLKRSFLG